MQYYRNLYVSEKLQKKKDKILDHLEHGRIQFQIYLIVLAENRQNHLEFFDAMMLQQHSFRNPDDIFLVGIADGYGEAVRLVEEIINDVLKETGRTDIRGYIEQTLNCDAGGNERQQVK